MMPLANTIPGLVFGLPLILLASFVFAATHHESPERIRDATIHWVVWLVGILGIVLAIVAVLGWLV